MMEDLHLLFEGGHFQPPHFPVAGIVHDPEEVLQRSEHIHGRIIVFGEIMNELQRPEAVEPGMKMPGQIVGVAMVPSDARPRLMKSVLLQKNRSR